MRKKMTGKLPRTRALIDIADNGPLSETEQQQIDKYPAGGLNMLGHVRQKRVVNSLIAKVTELEARLDRLDPGYRNEGSQSE